MSAFRDSHGTSTVPRLRLMRMWLIRWLGMAAGPYRQRRSCTTMARNPSHFTSNAQAPQVGIGPERASIG
jgi:hypothetical protein